MIGGSASCQPVSSSWWANGAVILTALGALTFVVLYALTTRGAWRSTVMGKHIMLFMIVILAVSSLGVAGIIWGMDWPYRDVIRTLAWSSVGGVIWQRVVLLYRVQHPLLPPTCDHDQPPTTT